MTERIHYLRTGEAGRIYGVPDGDLTEAGYAALPPNLQREVRHSPLYRAVPVVPAPAPKASEPVAKKTAVKPAPKDGE